MSKRRDVEHSREPLYFWQASRCTTYFHRYSCKSVPLCYNAHLHHSAPPSCTTILWSVIKCQMHFLSLTLRWVLMFLDMCPLSSYCFGKRPWFSVKVYHIQFQPLTWKHGPRNSCLKPFHALGGTKKAAILQALFKGWLFPGVGHTIACGTAAETGVRGHVGVWGGFCCSTRQYGWGQAGEEVHTHTHTNTQERAHTHTHTGMCTRMLHLPLRDLPFKQCPNHVTAIG